MNYSCFVTDSFDGDMALALRTSQILSHSASQQSGNSKKTWFGRKIELKGYDAAVASELIVINSELKNLFDDSILGVIFDYAHNLGDECIENRGDPDLIKKVKESNREEKVKKYLYTIINDPEFILDTKKYMEDWEKRRGNTEEYRLLEDPARHFLWKLLYDKGIVQSNQTVSSSVGFFMCKIL